MFHQLENTLSNELYSGIVYRSAKWAPHLHRGIEVLIVLDKTINVKIGDKSYILTKGECVFVPPYYIHSYEGEQDSLCYIGVFSGNFVNLFAKTLKNSSYEDLKFTPNEITMNYILQNLNINKDYPYQINILPPIDKVMLKSCLYGICSAFKEGKVSIAKKKDEELVAKILDYVEENFKNDVSLDDLASKLGYSEEYISRVFNKTLGSNFKTIVNQYRCEYAEYLITTTDNSLADIAMDSGFQSIRTFNRVFKQITGKSPSDIGKE